ncbi:hypothetical protein NQ038_13085 [Brevibacterium sp. 50QC2O2]|jgi:hypothetical protein|uniref:hypothetical protein n=1 Tax=Brevibacterium TaxID=1696 RepID=UPI00211C164A|nr:MULTISPECIES: hypothetical protein [unclassified Brevibacterium]MCQ9367194.1 hypothetical protein [Brevibacterium sp. 91QC2O2]MCQ9385669.1 hypothetical protein [Brevibacterium sp. 68QC2CO]MCQ9389573.1 hypothetical protein [Brevibacterium sp. 50QC2O2]
MFEYTSFIDAVDDTGSGDRRGALLVDRAGDIVFACQPVSLFGGKDTVTSQVWEAMDLAARERFTLLRWKLEVVRGQIQAGRARLADDDTSLLGHIAQMVKRRGVPADDDVAERVVRLQDAEAELLAELGALAPRRGGPGAQGKTSQAPTKDAWLNDSDDLLNNL